MARVDLVGGLLHGSTVGLTLEGHRAVATADLVFLPGDWSGEPIRALAAERLREGRLLTAADILEAAADVEHLVVLFSGAPPIATGRGAEFPSAQRLRELLSREGHEVQVIGGVSSIQAAALEAGLDLCTAEAPVLVVISAESPPTALPALRRAAATDAVLAVLWFEDHAPDLVGELASVRGASARAVLVRDLGLAPTAWDATLAAVLAGAKELRPPAVLFSFSAPDSLPVDFLDSVREWCAGLAPGLSWLIGPPGSGKTTWLRGVEQVAGDIHAVELGRLVSGLWAGPDRRQGAMKALDLAAAAVRSIDRKADERVVVACTRLPGGGLGEATRRREAVHVLLPIEDDWLAQFGGRPDEGGRGAGPSELRASWDAACQLAEMPGTHLLRPPHSRALLGRVHDADGSAPA